MNPIRSLRVPTAVPARPRRGGWRLTSAFVAIPISLTLAAAAPSQPVRDGQLIRFGLVSVDPQARTASLPGRVNMSRGVLEYALVTDYGKTHESLFVTDAEPADLQAALLLLGAKPSGPASLATNKPPSARPEHLVGIDATWDHAGTRTRYALHELVDLATADSTHSVTGHLAPGRWLFNGSMITTEGFAAHFEGSVIALIRDPSAVLNNPRPDLDDDDIHVPASGRVPTNGTPVDIRFSFRKDKPAP